MSKLLENKQQLVHIASEVVVAIGLVFYFSQKNKKLMSHIEDLAQRLEEQEDIIQKHDQMIQRLAAMIQQQSNVNHVSKPVTNEPNFYPQPQKKHRSRKPKTVPRSPPPSQPSQSHQKPLVESLQEPYPYPQEEYNEAEVYSEPEESDLDAELTEELGDLQEDKKKD